MAQRSQTAQNTETTFALKTMFPAHLFHLGNRRSTEWIKHSSWSGTKVHICFAFKDQSHRVNWRLFTARVQDWHHQRGLAQPMSWAKKACSVGNLRHQNTSNHFPKLNWIHQKNIKISWNLLKKKYEHQTKSLNGGIKTVVSYTFSLKPIHWLREWKLVKAKSAKRLGGFGSHLAFNNAATVAVSEPAEDAATVSGVRP